MIGPASGDGGALALREVDVDLGAGVTQVGQSLADRRGSAGTARVELRRRIGPQDGEGILEQLPPSPALRHEDERGDVPVP
jgi:hypothetical protein